MANWPWFNIVTMLVALYGAVLSTFNYFAQRRRDRTALKVQIVDSGDEGLSQPMLVVHVVNSGFRSVHLQKREVALILISGEKIFDLAPAGEFGTYLPCALKEGEQFSAEFPVNELSASLVEKGYKSNVRLCGQLIDVVGNVYRSRWHCYRIRTWKPKPDRPINITQIPS
jgi:hypothetical protein